MNPGSRFGHDTPTRETVVVAALPRSRLPVMTSRRRDPAPNPNPTPNPDPDPDPEHDDALSLIGGLDRLHDLGGVGSEGGVVQSCRDLDPYPPAVQHLLSQGDRGMGERTAV